MGVLYCPLLNLDTEPEAEDTYGDDGKQKPEQVLAEELSACAVEVKLLAVDDGVLRIPSLYHADYPGRSDGESDDYEKKPKQRNTDKTEKATVKS